MGQTKILADDKLRGSEGVKYAAGEGLNCSRIQQVGGFGLPFFILGSLLIVCGTATAVVMPSISDGKKMYKGSILNLLKSPIVIVTFINIVAGSMSMGFMDPTLSNHLLSEFHTKAWLIGIMFLIAPGVYALTAPVWGYIGDKKGKVRLMIFAGSAGAIISMLLLGPTPLPTLFQTLVLVGLTVGCCQIPTFKALLQGANSLGMPNDLDTYGKVSGFFTSSFSLGAFLGPTVGGTLVDKYGFPWSCMAVAGVFAVSAVLMLGHLLLVPKLPSLPEAQSKVLEVSAPTDGGDILSVNPQKLNIEASQTKDNQLSLSDEQQKLVAVSDSVACNGQVLSTSDSQHSVNSDQLLSNTAPI